MATPYLGEIRIVGFPFAPKGWALCNGQTMPINQNQALFSLLGTTFGGDGRTTFQLPDFRGRAPIEPGKGGNTPTYTYGQNGGEEQHTLVVSEMPGHSHTPIASSASFTLPSPSGNFWASGSGMYANSPINTPMAPNAIALFGNNVPHENRSPYLVVNFIIALTGIFPTRS
jgi:microcystin-dependent protein